MRGGGEPLLSIFGHGVGPSSLSLRLPLRRRHEGEGTSVLRSGLIVRVRFCLLRCVVRVVGATSEQINLPQLYSHTDDDLHGGVSGLMTKCGARSFGSAFWSSHLSSDLARSSGLLKQGWRGGGSLIVLNCVLGLHRCDGAHSSARADLVRVFRSACRR
jgi:hypothetical protein